MSATGIVHLILPMSVVVLSHLWYYAYLVRNRLVEELRADYVLLARSEGMGRAHIVLRQCLRNVLPSYLSLMAISVPHVMGGTYIVEAVFSYPGLGTLSYESARYKDYNLLMVLCLLSGAVVIACSLLAQAMNARLDPAPSPGGTGGDLKDRRRLSSARRPAAVARSTGTPARPWYRGKPIFSAAVLTLIVLGCLFCEVLLTHDPTYLDLAHCNEAPSREFLFGDGPDGPRYFLHDLVRRAHFADHRRSVHAAVHSHRHFVRHGQRLRAGLAGPSPDAADRNSAERARTLLLVVLLQAFWARQMCSRSRSSSG